MNETAADLMFQSVSSPDTVHGAVIDNIVLSSSTDSAAPEPASWALMLGGIGPLGAMLRMSRTYRRERGIATA